MNNNMLTENKIGYKKTKLGWIPEDWEVVRLENCFTLTSGITKPQTVSFFKDSIYKYPIYGGNGIIGYTDILFLKNDTILIGRVGEKCGCVYLIFNTDGYWVTDNALFINSIKINFNFNFMYYQLLKQNLNKLRRKSGQPLISQKPIYETMITFPPIIEQEKIAEVLSCWDEGIEVLEKLLEQKQLLKKALMQRLYSRKKTKFDKKIYKLGQLFTNRKETNCTNLELLSVCEGVGIIPRTQLNAKDNSNEDKSKYLKVCVGDIAYNTMRMWQGRCGVSNYEGIVSPAYTVCIPTEKINVNYMYYMFKTPHMIHDFWRFSQGIVEDTLNLKFNNFSMIKVEIPKKKVQQKIAEVLNNCDEEISLLDKKLEMLKQQRKGLMQKLLTGEIRLKA